MAARRKKAGARKRKAAKPKPKARPADEAAAELGLGEDDGPAPAKFDAPGAPAKGPKPMIPWDPRTQPAADTYMQNLLASVRNAGAHPVGRTTAAAGLVYMLSLHPELTPCPEDWDRQAVYEEAGRALHHWPVPDWVDTAAAHA